MTVVLDPTVLSVYDDLLAPATKNNSSVRKLRVVLVEANPGVTPEYIFEIQYE